MRTRGHGLPPHLIGARVKRERQARRWTPDQLAEALGVRLPALVALPEPLPGDVPHVYAHGGRQTARFCLAVCEPGVGSSTRTGVGDA